MCDTVKGERRCGHRRRSIETMAAAATGAETAVCGRCDGGATTSRDIKRATKLCLIINLNKINSTTFPTLR